VKESRRPGVKRAQRHAIELPAPTPPAAVLAAAKPSPRAKFGAKHLEPWHAHGIRETPRALVVKAEHRRKAFKIDKAMMREWRQDFPNDAGARDQPRMRDHSGPCGGHKRKPSRQGVFTGPRVGDTLALARNATTGIVRELHERRLSPTRRERGAQRRGGAVVEAGYGSPRNWEDQGEIVLGGHVALLQHGISASAEDRERWRSIFIRSRRNKIHRTREDERIRDRRRKERAKGCNACR